METITLAGLRRLIEVGSPICLEHGPHQEPIYQNRWSLCLAKLPEKLGISLETEDNFAMMGSSISSVSLRESPPGHRSIYVSAGTEADAFFADLQKKHATKDPWILGNSLTPVDKAFIRLDVAKFSQFPAALQPLVMADIQESADQILSKSGPETPPIEDILHIGDGFIAVYPWRPEDRNQEWLISKAGKLAALLDKKNDDTENRIQVHFRIAITLGTVYYTHDLKGKRNYLGTAINETERLISCMPPNIEDLVYFSDRVYRELRKYLEDRFSRIGSVADKHGIYHKIYSLEYLEFGEE